MPRVPVIDAPQARSEAFSGQRLQIARDTSGEAVQQGLQRLGSGLSQAARALHQEGKGRADEASVAAGLGDFQGAITDHVDDADKGLLRLRGQAAFDEEEKTFTSLEQARQSILQGKTYSPEARAEFDTRSRRMLDEARRRTEHFLIGQREVATRASVEKLSKSALDALARADLTDESVVEGILAEPLQSLAKTARGDEERELFTSALRKDADRLVLDKLIEKGRIEAASAYFQKAEGRLDAGVAKTFRDRLEKQSLAKQADKTAALIGLQATDVETGWLDAVAARELYGKLEGPEKDEVKERVESLITKADDNKARAQKQHYDELVAIYETEGNITSPRAVDLKAWLLDHRNGAVDRWRRFQGGIEREKKEQQYLDAAERRAIREENDDAYTEFEALSDPEQLETDVDAVYFDRADRKTRNRMKKIQKKLLEEKEAAVTPSESEVKAYATGKADESELLSKNKKLREKYISRMSQFARDYVLKNNGRSPTLQEVEEASSKALLDVVVDRKVLGVKIGTKTVPAFTEKGIPAQTVPRRSVPAPTKKIVKKLRSPSTGKTKIIYSDGTSEIQ